jgi:hypothetical protein
MLVKLFQKVVLGGTPPDMRCQASDVPVTRECGLVRWKAPTRSVELRDVSSACRISLEPYFGNCVRALRIKLLTPFFTRIVGSSPFVMIALGGLGRGRVERMLGPRDVYRLRTADMFAQAARNLRSLATAFLRLVDKADRNGQRVLSLDPNDPAAHHQTQQQPPQAAAATDSGTKHHRPGER